MKVVIDTKIIWLWIKSVYGPTGAIRCKAQQEISSIKAKRYMTEPQTGICFGCGKPMTNGLDVCSVDCLEVAEIQYSGF